MTPLEKGPASPRRRPSLRSDPALTPGRILDGLPLALLVVDSSGAVVFRNASADRLLPAGDHAGVLFGNATLLEPTEYLRTRQPARAFEGWPVVLSRAARGEVVQLCCAGGAQSLLSVQCSPLPGGPPGNPLVLMLVEPIALGCDADEQHEMSRRLASLGKLAARVAHELNNPLDGILRYINLALRIVGDAPESKLKAYLSESRTGLMRMVQIIGDLLEYSRSSGEFNDVGINEVIEEALRTMASAADERGVVVAADFQCADSPKVRGSRLYQVLCNLIRNALDAMPDGGRLTITRGVVGDDVLIRVADTGVGLPEPADKLFEPFFTTKPPGQGSGLGLAICKDFVEDMGGTIAAAHGERGGAVFTVRIPKGEGPVTNYQLPSD